MNVTKSMFTAITTPCSIAISGDVTRPSRTTSHAICPDEGTMPITRFANAVTRRGFTGARYIRRGYSVRHPRSEGESLRTAIDREARPRGEVARDHALRERVLEMALDRSLERACAVLR